MVADPNGHVDLADESVVSAIDSDGRSNEYVIADITADGAWLSMRADEAPALAAWR